MPAWLLPAASAAMSAVGGYLQNRSAAREARQNREFQERMSSSAAQRAAADYAAAGLNPALAYDRPASSPGGSVAPVEDVLSKGVSSGLAAKQMMANIELTRAQKAKVDAETAIVESDLSIRTLTGDGEPSWRDEQIAKRVAALRDLAHQGRLQPHDERLRALAVMLQRAQLKGAEFRGGMFDDAQALKDFIRAGLSSGRDAAEAFRAWMEAARATRVAPPAPKPRQRRSATPSAPADATRRNP